MDLASMLKISTGPKTRPSVMQGLTYSFWVSRIVPRTADSWSVTNGKRDVLHSLTQLL